MGPMKKVIEDILAEEKKARERINEAREKAKQNRISAEEEAIKILADARRKGVEESKVLMAQAEEEAQKEKDKELKKASRLTESLWTEKGKAIEHTIEVLCRMVLGEDGQ